jgi:hypothetical protein
VTYISKVLKNTPLHSPNRRLQVEREARPAGLRALTAHTPNISAYVTNHQRKWGIAGCT